jgi:hypothetical protein
MLLTSPDYDTRRLDKRRQCERAYQDAMTRQLAWQRRRYPDQPNNTAWFTYFVWWPLRIGPRKVVWLGFVQASPIGTLHGRWSGRRDGFASVYWTGCWNYRHVPLTWNTLADWWRRRWA